MIVDIGRNHGDCRDLGGIVSQIDQDRGDDFTEDIQTTWCQHNIKVGDRTAEQIKINGLGADGTDDPPEDFVVHGPNRMTSLPMDVPVSYQEIAHCIEKSVTKVDSAVLSALEQTPPELYADIVRNGIHLTGGGALLRGLDKRLTEKIGIPFKVVDDPLHMVAKGTSIAPRNIDVYFLMRRVEATKEN